MACEQRVRTAQDTQLLPNMVATEQQSLVLVKKLLAIAVSSITYLRGLFPEKAYGHKYVEEQKVMILREERSCPGARQIVQWMQGCFDALQRKYLRMVVLSIYTDPENPQKVTECYRFRVQYTKHGPQMTLEGENNKRGSQLASSSTKKASILLVRKLYTLMQNLGPLPDNVCLNMQLSYYDDVTPQDYHPPGFKEGDSESLEFEKEPVELSMGDVVTPFHTLKVDVTTERERLEQVEEEGPACGRDKWMVKMHEENPKIEVEIPTDDLYMDNSGKISQDDSEIQLSRQVKITEITEKPQTDTLVKVTSNVEATVRKTRSGRVLPSYTKKKKAEPEVRSKMTHSSVQEKMMSQFEFPCSQEPPSPAPKKRKFSEPKERY